VGIVAAEAPTVRLGPVVGLLVVLLIAVPILELAVFVQVAAWIGWPLAVLLIIAFSVGGAWLMKREGLAVLRRSRQQWQRGEVPAVEVVNGLLILVAGMLMVLPGFITDVLGLVLLIPPTRTLVRVALLRRFEKRIRAALTVSGPGDTRTFTGTATYGGKVVDVRETAPREPGEVREIDGRGHRSGPNPGDGPPRSERA
jgi:UPF0716 protein FxsA